MDWKAWPAWLDSSETAVDGADAHLFTHRQSREALGITAEMNHACRTTEELSGI